VMGLRRSGEKSLTDERILGSNDFLPSVLTGRQVQQIIARSCKEEGISIQESQRGIRRGPTPASSILFSLEPEAGIGSAFGGDSSEVGCFNLYNLPIPGRKPNMSIKLVNPVPDFASPIPQSFPLTGNLLPHRIILVRMNSWLKSLVNIQA
jgi:hypothetical protein